MIKIENTEVIGWEHVIRGMRNPMNSWAKSDSGICKGGDDGIGCKNCANDICHHPFDSSFQLGKNDYGLMMRLAAAGPVHAKYRRMIVVYADITAPLYWWKEFDTYKIGTVANSCSTMHKIAEKEFTLDDFSHEHLLSSRKPVLKETELAPGVIKYEPKYEKNIIPLLDDISPKELFLTTIDMLNLYRKEYLETKDKRYWWQLIQLLPSSYNQRRTVMMNYEVLAGLYPWRKDHKLDEWHKFCDWIRQLPWSEIITGKEVLE